jgi:hypothetical protein
MIRSFALPAAALLGVALLTPAEPVRAAAVVGQPAPEFTVTDASGKSHALSAYKGKWVVLEWVNFECPFVKKHYGSGNMQKLQQAAVIKGAAWLTVNSSAPGKQGHYAPEMVLSMLKERGAQPSAYLLDSDGTMGRAYGAKTTPHMFVIDPKGTVVYAGGIDDKATTDVADVATAKNYVQAALDEAMAGKQVSTPTSTPYGCSVKY